MILNSYRIAVFKCSPFLKYCKFVIPLNSQDNLVSSAAH